MPIYKMDGKKDGLQKYRVRINYTDRDGKPKQLDRVAYGKEAAKELERELAVNTNEPPARKLTLQKLYDEYISVKQHEVRETTMRGIKERIELYVLPPLADCRIDRLTAPALQKWKLAIEEKKTNKGKELSYNRKKSIFADFHALLNYAAKMDYIPKNPLDSVGNFKDALEKKKEMVFYTPDEFLKFIAAAKEICAEREKTSVHEWNYYVFFNIAFYTGMRKGEINALKWTDADGDVIHISRSITQKLKGNDLETPPKNKSSIRDIQIPVPLKNVLKEHYSRCKTTDGFSDDWHICGGERCLRDSSIERRNAAYAKAANVKKIRIHDFRHSHASLLANNGINIQEIARRLGHSNVNITWNVYSHMYPREEERAVQILNQIS